MSHKAPDRLAELLARQSGTAAAVAASQSPVLQCGISCWINKAGKTIENGAKKAAGAVENAAKEAAKAAKDAADSALEYATKKAEEAAAVSEQDAKEAADGSAAAKAKAVAAAFAAGKAKEFEEAKRKIAEAADKAFDAFNKVLGERLAPGAIVKDGEAVAAVHQGFAEEGAMVSTAPLCTAVMREHTADVSHPSLQALDSVMSLVAEMMAGCDGANPEIPRGIDPQVDASLHAGLWGTPAGPSLRCTGAPALPRLGYYVPFVYTAQAVPVPPGHHPRHSTATYLMDAAVQVAPGSVALPRPEGAAHPSPSALQACLEAVFVEILAASVTPLGEEAFVADASANAQTNLGRLLRVWDGGRKLRVPPQLSAMMRALRRLGYSSAIDPPPAGAPFSDAVLWIEALH